MNKCERDSKMDTRVRSLDAEPSSRRVSAAGRGPKDDDDGENQLFLADVIFGERIINELFAVRRCESQREGEKNGRRRCEPDRERVSEGARHRRIPEQHRT